MLPVIQTMLHGFKRLDFLQSLKEDLQESKWDVFYLFGKLK